MKKIKRISNKELLDEYNFWNRMVMRCDGTEDMPRIKEQFEKYNTEFIRRLKNYNA